MDNIQKLDSVFQNTGKPDNDAPDLDNPASRLDYLRGKLNDIMSNIGTIYGERLTRELLRRLEATIQEFHQEVLAMLDRLEKLEEERRKILTTSSAALDTPEPAPEEDTLSDWERRLEMLEREHATQTKPETESSNTTPSGKRYFIGKKGLKR